MRHTANLFEGIPGIFKESSEHVLPAKTKRGCCRAEGRLTQSKWPYLEVKVGENGQYC